MTETTALVLKAQNEPFEISTVLLDSELQDQDVLVEIHATGICHTDIGVQKLGKFPGKFPRVLGHEGSLSLRQLGLCRRRHRQKDWSRDQTCLSGRQSRPFLCLLHQLSRMQCLRPGSLLQLHDPEQQRRPSRRHSNDVLAQKDSPT